MLKFEYLCYLNNENNSSERFSYLKGDYQGFITSLKELDWDSLLANKNIDQMWTCFSTIMSEHIDKLIPKRKTHHKFVNPPLWMDRATKSIIIKNRKAWIRYKFSRSKLAHARYVKGRNVCTNAIKIGKLSFERKVALEAKTNVKSFWNYVNSNRLSSVS